jgi:hypothetical protein
VTDARRELEFVYTPLFDAAAADLVDDEAMRHVELSLLAEPRAGAVVAGTDGIRKLRAPLPGRGKRGGARVLYLYIEVRGRIYFLLAYAKNEQFNLSPAQKKALRDMVKYLEELG